MQIVGAVKQVPINSVKPNGWNPNRFSDEMKASLRYGLEHDGWYASHALLVWGKDKRGKQRDLIIDGEHRWAEALALGFKKAPAVFVDGLTEAQAKALTVKLDQKRGRFDDADLGALLRSIQHDLGEPDMGLALGFADESLLQLLAEPPISLDGGGGSGAAPQQNAALGGTVVSQNAHVKMVPLYFDAAAHEEFMALVKPLSERYETETVTDTVMAALRATSAKKKR